MSSNQGIFLEKYLVYQKPHLMKIEGAFCRIWGNFLFVMFIHSISTKRDWRLPPESRESMLLLRG